MSVEESVLLCGAEIWAESIKNKSGGEKLRQYKKELPYRTCCISNHWSGAGSISWQKNGSEYMNNRA